MPIIVSESAKKDRLLPPADTMQAVCYDVWPLGKQRSVFKDEVKILDKVRIAWELDETIPKGEYAGKRFTISAAYTLSLHKKAKLRLMLEAWRGRPFTEEELKGFDLEKLIGINAMLTVVHSEDGQYANVGSVVKPPKNLPHMTPENPRGTPEWIKKIQAAAIKDEEVPMDAIEPAEIVEAPEEESVPF